MRILHLIGWPLYIGGHIKSTLTLLKALESRGHESFLLGCDGPFVNELRKEGIRVFTFNSDVSDHCFSIKLLRTILNLNKKYRFDIFHAQDYRSLFATYMAAFITGTPPIFTRAGKELSNIVIPKEVPVIVYSKELENGMQKMGYKNKIFFIPERIDCSTFRPMLLTKNFVKKNNLPQNGLKIIMTMRFEKQKKPWLKSFFDGIDVEKIKEKNMYLFLAGDGSLSSYVKKSVEELNKKASKKIIFFLGPILKQQDLVDFLNFANIIVGHGRSVLEGMACGKAAIVIGEREGLATTVEPNTVEIISYYNFSGRHLRYYPEMGSPLTAEILKIASNTMLLKNLGNFSLEYIKKYYDIEKGINKLEHLYNSTYRNYKHSCVAVMEYLFKYLFRKCWHSIKIRLQAISLIFARMR